MKTLLKNGSVVNVFTGAVERTNVLLEDEKIVGVGDYDTADVVEDVSGKTLCPGFMDGHIHIESTMLTPPEFARAVLPHGTVAVVADPHEIANVCGMAGIQYMLKMSEGLPVTVYIMLPSCVPATRFDESGAELTAEDLDPYFMSRNVLGLAEMMNYAGTISGDEQILRKIRDAKSNNKVVDGHAPLLTRHALDAYIAAGIQSDHECSSFAEAAERIRKGQWLMIRQGTAARNLDGLIDLFDEPWAHRCLLVTDDRHPADLLREGHIDNIIRRAVRHGKSAVTGIQMATIQAAQCFGLHDRGAVAPGYRADILVLNDLESVDIRDVYCGGKKLVDNKVLCEIEAPVVRDQLRKSVLNSFYVDRLQPEDFFIEPEGARCRVIKTIPDQLLTDEWITEIVWDRDNGVDLERDILKVAVIERHMHTGHRSVGFISGIGMKAGAIASSVSHDSHNIVVIGTNDGDMARAANRIVEMGGGCAAVRDGEVLADVPLPIAGLMSDKSAAVVAEENAALLRSICALGVPETASPLMTMAFMSLTVIPSLKLTTQGLVDVDRQTFVPLYAD